MATLEAALAAEFGTQMEDWRARLPDLKMPDFPNGYERRDLKVITAISVHHAAADATIAPDVIHRFHQSINGPNAPKQSPGIAYHLYIYLTGQVWKVAYTGDIATVRWHTASNNSYTFGVCAGGNYETEPPPWEVINLLQRIIAVVKAFLGRPIEVKQHRAFPNTSTTCPGKLGDGDTWQAVLQVPAPKPPPGPDPDVIRKAAFDAAGIPYNPTAAFVLYARAHGLGAPMGPEFSWTQANDIRQYSGQGFVKKILWCPTGAWNDIHEEDW